MRYSRNETWWKNYDWLYEQYIVLDRRTEDIANEVRCKQCTVQDWLRRFGISKAITKHFVEPTHTYETYEYLYEQHIINKKSMAQIARENGVSQDTIRYNLRKCGVQIWRTVQRTKLTEEQIKEVVYKYSVLKMSANALANEYGVGRCQIVKYLSRNGIVIRDRSQAQLVLSDVDVPKEFYSPEVLNKLHWEDGLSCKDIAARFGVDPGTVRRQMHRLGLKTKTDSESKIGLMTGDKHPNWKGGITDLYALLREYFHTNIQPKAALRDEYTCQICGKQHTVLHVHHIVYLSDIVSNILQEHQELSVENDKQELYEIIVSDNRFLDLNNLITLCVDCHRQIHRKRD